jgi:hypothetical protein
MAHHEAISEKLVSFMWRGGKLTAQTLARMMKRYLDDMKRQNTQSKSPKTYQGKQSVKNLVGQGQGVSNIEVTDGNIKSFERTARKYGVDFALKKDSSVEPPKWLVFFKAKDADALTAAFKEFSSKTLKRQKSKASLLDAVKQFKELASQLAKDLVKNKRKGREER